MKSEEIPDGSAVTSLTADETLHTTATTNSLPAEDELVAEYTPLLRWHADRICRGFERLREDFFQEGALGLIQAARRYDPSKGATFATYADRHIRGRMRNLRRAESKHSRCVSFEDIASRDAADDAPEQGTLPLEAVEDPKALTSLLVQVEWALLEKTFDELFTERQREILNLHFRDGLSGSEIATQICVSAARVSQVLSEAASKMRLACERN